MRLLICGDRNWDNARLIRKALEQLMTRHTIECVIEGEARGADSLARQEAERLKIPVLKFPADWDRHGKAAGVIRNQQMLTEGKPTHVLAFHNDIINSKGTGDMVHRAQAAGLPWHVIHE